MAKVLFLGTPLYARIILEGLLDRADLDIRVVTKADMPQGRRLQLMESPVAELARQRGIETDKPEKLVDFRDLWSQFQPDILITAAYGKILRPWLLSLPTHGAFNLHASLLPRWRGPNPIAWAIRAGDAQTGVTLMAMDAGVDTGAIVAQSGAVPIRTEDTLGLLTVELAQQARNLLIDHLQQLLEGQGPTVSQDESAMTYAGKFPPEDAHICWDVPAAEISRLIQSMSPDPGAYTLYRGMRIKILDGEYDEGEQTPGVARVAGNAWRVGSAQGVVVIHTIRPAGRKEMTPGDFMRGLHAAGEVVCE